MAIRKSVVLKFSVKAAAEGFESTTKKRVQTKVLQMSTELKIKEHM